MNTASPLRHFPAYQTSDPEISRHILSAYGLIEYDITAAASTFEQRVNRVILRDMSIAHSACSAGIRIKFLNADFLTQRICLTGLARATSGHVSNDLDARQWSAVVRAGEQSSINFEPGYEELRLAVDNGVMRRKLAALLGESFVGEIIFAPESDVGSPGLLRFRRLLSFLLSELDMGGPHILGPVIDEIAETLLISYLYGQNHNLSHRLQQFPRPPSLSQFRRAEDFITANWSTALSIEGISKATSLSARSIFRSFKQTHGCSPFEYIKRVRLQHAHTMLVQGSLDVTVTGVAFKCGFHSLGHFARSYHAAFGELPSETVRQARRH